MMEVKDYQTFFSNLSKILLIINAILFLTFNLKPKKALKIFSWYLVVIVIIQIKSYLLLIEKENNLYLSHYYFILQFIFLGLFYLTIFKSKSQKKAVIIVEILVLIILGLQYYYDPSLYLEFNLLEIVLTSLAIVSFSVLYFYNSLIEKTEFIYINSGIFIYLLCSTLIFCSGNIFTDQDSSTVRNILWLLNSILYIVYLIFIFLEWYKSLKKTN